MKTATTGATSRSAAAATAIAAQRQSNPATQARKGRNTSWPEALLAESSPVTSPWRLANQRFATMAASGIAIAAVAAPFTTPQSR